MRHDGRVTSDRAGRPVVHRPDGTTDDWWDGVVDLLRPLADTTGRSTVVVPESRTAALRAILERAPASAVNWRFNEAASRTGDRVGRSRAVLERIVGAEPAVQARWPDGLDLGATGFARQLRPFQRDAVARLLYAVGGANFSVPGSGKTTVAYAVYAALKARGEVHGMVVVAPPSAFEAWQEEAAACFADGHVPVVAVRPDVIGPATDVVVFNYERLYDPAVRTKLAEWSRNRRVLTVFDEAHRAKAGQRSQRGAAAAELARRSDLRTVLTGTPMPNGEADLEAVFDLVWPGQGHRLVGHGDLSSRLDRAFVRVTKDDLDLPELAIRAERVALDPNHRTLYDAMVDRVAEWADDPAVTAADAGRALMRLIAATTNPAAVFSPDLPFTLPADQAPTDLANLVANPARYVRPAKIVRAAQIVADNRADGRKTLVWSSFVSNINAITAALEHHSPAVVMGATPVDDPDAPTDRVRELNRFRSDPDCWALVATPQTLGEGVSLHHWCTDQVHVDRGYAAGTWLQSIDRTHRLGLRDDAKPTCTVIVAADTVDERVDEVLGDKVRAMADALNDHSLRPVADPMIVPDDPVASVLGDLDALRELVSVVG